MIPRTLTELAERLGAESHADGSSVVTGFATDSGSVKEGDLFLAFKGSRVDGHAFAKDALERGAVAALVSQPVAGPYLLVPDVIAALARVASGFRDGFDGPVVAITGSAGKTTTKEFVAAALAPLGPILKSEGNRNSEYTSPLVWTDLTSDHQAVVVEMAMRGFGQIRHLASFARPTVGLVTNIGYAHLEMVGSREGIADAKGELLEALSSSGTAILWHEDDYRERLASKTSASIRTFGNDAGADCRILHYQALDWDKSQVEGELDGQRWRAEVPAIGEHIALNAAAAVLTASVCGVAPQDAAAGIAKAVLPPMRMQVLRRNDVHVLLDNYNASPPSMLAAIKLLSDMPISGRRFAVIGDMRELGDATEEAHRQVGRALAASKVDRVMLVGESVRFVAEEVGGKEVSRTKDIEDVRRFIAQATPGDAVLVKGSRALELERALES